MEEKMRIVSRLAPMVALSLMVVLGSPVSALAGDGAGPFHKHAVPMHRFAYADLSPNATALAPAAALVRMVPAKDTDGLSRNDEDCNSGCIDH
jgi:hypothetical protein